MTDAELEFAAQVWAYGNNDEVWEAVMNPTKSRFFDPNHEGEFLYEEVASELLDRIQRSSDFTVGDLTNEQVQAAIVRRYPILGPPPHNFGS